MTPGIHTGPRHAARRPVARGHEDRDLRPRLLLGRREGLLAAPRRRDDGGRLRRRLTRRTRPTRRPAPAGPATPRSSWSPTTRRGSRYEQLLKTFWEHHDPTQGMRQGNDVGTQYRSIIFVADDEQRAAAEASKAMYQEQLSKAGYGTITTEIVDAASTPFYYAEDYHQQYLDKNPARLLPEPRDRREAAGRLRGHAAAVRGLARPSIITAHESDDTVRTRCRHRRRS